MGFLDVRLKAPADGERAGGGSLLECRGLRLAVAGGPAEWPTQQQAGRLSEQGCCKDSSQVCIKLPGVQGPGRGEGLFSFSVTRSQKDGRGLEVFVWSHRQIFEDIGRIQDLIQFRGK